MPIIKAWRYFSFCVVISHQNWLIMAYGTIKRTYVVVTRSGSKSLHVSEKNIYLKDWFILRLQLQKLLKLHEDSNFEG